MAEKLRKGDLRKKLKPLLHTHWQHDFQVESKVRSNGDKVLPKLRKLLESGGEKNFIAVCQEFGALGECVYGPALETFAWLLDLGVSSSAPSKDGRDTDLLVALVRSTNVADDVVASMMQTVIASGHDVNLVSGRGETALGEVARLGRWALSGPLVEAANESTRASALIAAIGNAEDAAEDSAAFERLDEALERLDPNAADAAGQTPLHAAAATGRLAIWDRIAPRVNDKEPNLTGDVVRNGLGYPSAPGGGVIPSARFPVGSTPLDCAQAVAQLFARGRSVYEAAEKLQPFHVQQLEKIIERADAFSALIERLTGEGAISGAEKVVIDGPHGDVQKQLLRLAESADCVDVVERAIQSSHSPQYGPLNLLLRTVSRCHAELTPAVKSDAHPLASLIRGTHQAKRIVYSAKPRKGPNIFHAKPADYPKEAKRAFKALLIGLHEETVLAGTVEPTGVVIWAITPDAMQSLGSVLEFLENGVDVILGEKAPEAVAAPAEPEARPKTWIDGVAVCITGKMKRKRAEAERELANMGAVINKSITKKTKVLFAGGAAGSKVHKAQQNGVLILDEGAMEMTLRGEDPRASAGEPELDVRAPAEPKEKKPLTPFPHVDPAPPEDGEFETHHPSGALASRGRYEGGKKVGIWTSFYEDGAVSAEETFVDGLLHGDNVYFHTSGEVRARGRSEAGKSEGTWAYFHDSGAPSFTLDYVAGQKNGPYTYTEADGRVKTTGAYRNDKFVGQWTWLRQVNHEKVTRGYDPSGSKHGVESAWWPGGELAYHREWTYGRRTGRHEERAKDGTITKRERYDDRGRPVERTNFDGGKEKVVAYVDGVPKKLADNDKRLSKLADKLDDAADIYKAESALQRVVEHGEMKAVVQLLWRRGMFDLPAYPDFHDMLTDDDVPSATVMEFLRAAAVPKNDLLFAGWSRGFDTMVARAYAEDPEPIDVGWRDLPDAYRRGVAFVLARFGVDVGDALAGLGPEIARAILDEGMFRSIAWPERDADERWIAVTQDLFRRNEPAPLFNTLLELVMDPADWPAVLLAEGLELAKTAEYGVQLDRFEPGFRVATLEQLEVLLSNAQLTGRTAYRALLEWRNDDAEALSGLALRLEDKKTASWVASAAVVRATAAGKAPAAEVVARVLPELGSRDNWLYDARQADPAARRGEPAALDAAVNFAMRSGVGEAVDYPDGALVFAALRALPDAEVRKRAEAFLAKSHEAPRAGPLLHLVDDPAFWRSSLETIAKASRKDAQTVWGLGYLPASALPMFIELRDAAPAKTRWIFVVAVAEVLARAASRGETWSAEFDSVIQSLFAEPKRVPFEMLAKILFRMPSDRREAVMLAALDSGDAHLFATAVRMLAWCPTAPVLQRAFVGLAEATKLTPDHVTEMALGLAAFEGRGPWIEWAMRNGARPAMHEAFERADRKAFQALTARLSKEGTAPKSAPKKRAPDKIDEVVKLAKKTGGGGSTVYLFRRTDQPDSTLNRIGGLPPGTPAEAWPRQDDDAMVHLFTVDLATVPELRAQLGGQRTMSLFVGNPDSNEAFEPYTNEVAVQLRDDGTAKKESAAPEDTPVRDTRGFEVVTVDVPDDVWEGDSQLRRALYQAGARAGGEPIWLQGDEHHGQFLMQFDESFADINLGDSGLMYVFTDTAFWQCH
ncbi:MAG: hypothetical protein AB8I08_19090 [Sandaracinaceae bacterium]